MTHARDFNETAKSLRMYSLPNELICHIISYLPLRETIKTSILSKRWRHLFARTATLTIDDSIKKPTLVRLKLEFRHSFGVSIPHTVCLPNLKFLHLRHIVFSDNESVQRLFSGCHMLEELLLSHCSQKIPGKFMACSPTLKRLILTSFTDCKELMINALNLVYFKHSNFVVTHYSILNLHSLIEARIDVGLFTVAFFYQTTTPDLLRGISNTRSLHFRPPSWLLSQRKARSMEKKKSCNWLSIF
ncbi:hypothetical protein ES332_D13G175200v1 [Gossypium tomentosum]|uniref:F-box domain-containing protein n=1 Tax=Gossypium tomentosum TaxID=34277 RepID=A0A5D2I078_GOSTO|nr:hypothetical protein ES332_D13G175200v1 [Gossypium tomentosum]